MSRLKKGSAIAAVCCALVGSFEGLRQVAYLDVIGVPTACYGEIKNIKLGMKFTRQECEGMLIESLMAHERGMMACTKVELPDDRYAALLSFTYNVGVGAYCGSTLVKKLNAGDVVGACNELSRWTRAKGIVFPGLVKRRAAERELCLKGVA